jgi:alpha-glucoside transport system permease protein
MDAILTALVAVILGPIVTFALYAIVNALVSRLPRKVSAKVLPYVFIAPVLALVSLFLVYPTVQTIMFSFMNADSSEWVGMRNYNKLFADEEFLHTLANNFAWVAIVPALTVILGLLIATLTDRLGSVRERVFKSIIFMPMAISFVAASSVWRLTYSWNPDGNQVGLLNAIIQAFGGQPFNWLQTETLGLNNFLLMVIVLWAGTGFAMTLLSAAIKSVPQETVEAASIDGANGAQTFFRIIVPQIRGTMVAVFITTLISAMKIFDVIWGMTGGNYHTNVLGVDFFLQYFVYNHTGKASAVVVLLVLAIIPIMIYQVRSYRKQEELR